MPIGGGHPPVRTARVTPRSCPVSDRIADHGRGRMMTTAELGPAEQHFGAQLRSDRGISVRSCRTAVSHKYSAWLLSRVWLI
jgi:hypothetical protein